MEQLVEVTIGNWRIVGQDFDCYFSSEELNANQVSSNERVEEDEEARIRGKERKRIQDKIQSTIAVDFHSHSHSIKVLYYPSSSLSF